MEHETIQTAVAEPTSEAETVVATEEAPVDTDAEVTDEVPESAPTETDDVPVQEEAAPQSAAEELVFTPVYNGEVTPIKASDTEEVTTLLQLGMKQRAFLPVYEQLDQLAHESGAKNIAEFVQNAFDYNEQKHLDEAIARYGDEEGKAFYEYQKEQRSKAYSRYQEQTAQAEREAVSSRNEMLATQFVEMQAEYPEYAEFKDVPKAVVDLALDKGIHLMDAMARFKRSEERKGAQAAATAKKGAEAATGSMTDAADAGADPLWEAFMRGVNSRM